MQWRLGGGGGGGAPGGGGGGGGPGGTAPPSHSLGRQLIMQWRLVVAGAVISTVCASGVVWQRLDHVQVQAAQQQVQDSQQQQFERAQLLPRSPLAVLLAVMRSVA